MNTMEHQRKHAAVVSRGPNLRIVILHPEPWLNNQKNPWDLRLDFLKPNGTYHEGIHWYQAATLYKAVSLAADLIEEIVPADATTKIEGTDDDQ